MSKILNCNTLYTSDDLRIVRMENWFGMGATSDDEAFNKEMRAAFKSKRTYLFYQINTSAPCENTNYFLRKYIENHLAICGLNLRNLIIECPDERVFNHINDNTNYQCIPCNHNSLLDYRLYNLDNIEKEFDAVINARPLKWKNLHLSENVKNLAFIKGPGNEYDYAKRKFSFVN
jgi:hypothetical protein